MKKLAIEGHKTRGKEVIELLEMLGGKNNKNLHGYTSPGYYYIDYGEINCNILKDNYIVYTLEDFFQKFPFKVGDRVNIPEYESEVRINAIKWDVYSKIVLYMVYRVDEEEWYTTEELLDYNDIEDYKSRYTKIDNTAGITNKTLGIKGHSRRSEDVKSLLIMLGGRIEVEDLPFDVTNFVFYIGNDKCVYCITESSFNGVIYSLEEFKNKFPYKTGDLVKCWVKGQYGAFKIEQMYWYNLLGMATVRYIIYNMHYYPEDLQPYESPEIYTEDTKSHESNAEKSESLILKSEVLEDIPNEKENNDVEFQLPEGFQFIDDKGEVINTTKIILERIKPKYPKTYAECCGVIGFGGIIGFTGLADEEEDLYAKFIILKRCRDAYWKIAGEQMGLDKPWKPDWKNRELKKYCIYYETGIIQKGICVYHNSILAFPTEEMRDAFYDNFKDLIEKCKELL